MSLTTFLQQCLAGISLGGAYALTAIGYTPVYDIPRPINLTHGNILMMAGYFMIFVIVSLPWFIAAPITLTVIILLGATIEWVVCRPLRSAPRMSVMIPAIGIPHLLQNLATYLFTALPKGYPEIPFLKKVFRIGGLSASFITFLTPILALVLIYLLILLINHTKIGTATRAVSKDYKTASLVGIKINKTITFTFAVGSLLAGIGSTLYLTDHMTVLPFPGALPGLRCFVAAVFGGIGSIPGAIIGGFILGLGETAPVVMGQSTSGGAFTLILLIVMFLIRPTGLFGEKMTGKTWGGGHEEYDKEQERTIYPHCPGNNHRFPCIPVV